MVAGDHDDVRWVRSARYGTRHIETIGIAELPIEEHDPGQVRNLEHFVGRREARHSVGRSISAQRQYQRLCVRQMVVQDDDVEVFGLT